MSVEETIASLRAAGVQPRITRGDGTPAVEGDEIDEAVQLGLGHIEMLSDHSAYLNLNGHVFTIYSKGKLHVRYQEERR